MLGKSRTWTAHIPVDYDNKPMMKYERRKKPLGIAFFMRH